MWADLPVTLRVSTGSTCQHKARQTDRRMEGGYQANISLEIKLIDNYLIRVRVNIQINCGEMVRSWLKNKAKCWLDILVSNYFSQPAGARWWLWVPQTWRPTEPRPWRQKSSYAVSVETWRYEAQLGQHCGGALKMCQDLSWKYRTQFRWFYYQYFNTTL